MIPIEIAGVVDYNRRMRNTIDVKELIRRVNASTTITTFIFHETTDELLMSLCAEITNPRLRTFVTIWSYLGSVVSTKTMRIIAKNLPNLTTLDLFGYQLGVRGVNIVSSMNKLTTLKLSWCNVGNEGAIKIATKLTNLTTLILIGCRIGNVGVKSIATLEKLTSLDLSYNNDVGNGGAIALSKMTQLTTLDLSHNIIANEGMTALMKLPNLISLNVRFNDTDSTRESWISAFEAHPTLFDLDVWFDDEKRIEVIKNRKRMRAFRESISLNDNVTSKIFEFL